MSDSSEKNEICVDQLKIVNGKKVRIYSLVFITDIDKKKVLLGLKKRGFGLNKFNGFGGTVKESDEMAPKWFDINEVPFDSMWIDDAFWYPYFLRGDHFNGFFQFEDEKKIICQYITCIDKNVEIQPIYGNIKAS